MTWKRECWSRDIGNLHIAGLHDCVIKILGDMGMLEI